MKILVIINGVTGAIGTACLARFSREQDVTIYGLSRKANLFSTFINETYLPDNSLISSIGDISAEIDCKRFVDTINLSLYEKIIYIHAVGFYPFEMNEHGEITVSNDIDGDGIDDKVVNLSHTAFFSMTNALREKQKPVNALILGSISDKHTPAVHKSWWTTMGRIKEDMHIITSEEVNINFSVLNISSVICPHEMITRPFVFQNTNANSRFWLMPHEVAEKIATLTLSNMGNRFTEQDLFHKADYYQDDYFSEIKFTDRKKAELGITAIKYKN